MGESSAVPRLDDAELLSWPRQLSNGGRWGSADELGTRNYITGEQRRAAAALVRDGDVVSCAKSIGTAPSDDQLYGAPQRLMLSTEGLEGGRPQTAGPQARSAVEYVGFVFHGRNITHLDALSHVSSDGRLYNGYPEQTISPRDGATRLARHRHRQRRNRAPRIPCRHSGAARAGLAAAWRARAPRRPRGGRAASGHPGSRRGR